MEEYKTTVARMLRIREEQERAAEGKLKPQMGWSTWNFFRQNNTEASAFGAALAMKQAGLADAGYVYLNLDDCWQASERTPEGLLQFDPGAFPSREGFVQKINALGLRLGLYSSCGDLTCEDLPGSYHREETDADTFARWGVSYLKYDYCHVVDMPTDANGEKTFPSQTPPIVYIGITPMSERGDETKYPAVCAELSGDVRIEEHALRGLSCSGGWAMFRVTAPHAGEYALAVCYKKSFSERRQFALAVVNDMSDYELWFPRSSGWSETGRIHSRITLNKGENTIRLYNPILGQKEDSYLRYRRMGQALTRVAKRRNTAPIFYSVCEHGRAAPWEWAGEFASSWRVGHDIRDSWESVLACYEKANSLWQHQRPGAYNDPDMLEVGVGNLTEVENRAHFSLWCMLSAPLILGCDVRRFVREDALGGIDRSANNGAYDIITNRELIALNQDGLLLQAKRIAYSNGIDVLVKPLWGGDAAVLFFNKTEICAPAQSLNLAELHVADSRVTLQPAEQYFVKNLWGSSDFSKQGMMLDSGNIPPHGVAVLRIKNT